MKLAISKNPDVNYLSKVVYIGEFNKHPDPEVERLKCCTIDGFNVIVGIDYEPGLYIYFPALSQINGNLLHYCNLYRHKEKNADNSVSGLFEDNGKVSVIKLKGVASEGFIISSSLFESWIISLTNKNITNLISGVEFDSIEDGEKTLWISKKYVPKRQGRGYSKGKKRDKPVKKTNIICNKQFRFHYNTVILKSHPEMIDPNDYIQITSKIHGTSGISANILTKKTDLTFKERLSKLLFGNHYYKYDNVYSSRRVIRNGTKEDRKIIENRKMEDHDIWWHANRIVAPKLSNGVTAYYEIVGYQPDGEYIQKNYDYGCIPPVSSEFMCHEENFKVRIYRVTYTSCSGVVYEASPFQIQRWCDVVGLIPVKELWYGKAMDLYPDIPVDYDWNINFIDRLSNDNNFYMEMDSPDCNNKVPHEGVVIRMENNPNIAVKLKSFRFLSKVDSNEEANIEDEN